MIMFEKRQLVLPGDLIAKGDYIAGENVYKVKDKLYAQKIGLIDFDGKKVYIIPLKGRYIPKVGDIVIGQITDIGVGSWIVDINSPYSATLLASDVTGKPFSPKTESLTKILNIGDVIIGKITAFDRTKNPSLTVKGPGLGKVSDGIIVDITPTKIPRLIGKRSSMLNTLKEETGCDIVVGQNGKILIRGKNFKMVELLVKAIRMVDEQAHTTGLTDRVKAFLSSSIKGG
ncbi:RNA-binding protein [Candidatus Bathyarchaeota archaeon]|nr:MAG: RNA-binding protein [Candidatus Bathyarchaeota archaeon]